MVFTGDVGADIWEGLETSSQPGSANTGICGTEARAAAQHATVHRTAPPTKNEPACGDSAGVEKPRSRC